MFYFFFDVIDVSFGDGEMFWYMKWVKVWWLVVYLLEDIDMLELYLLEIDDIGER